MSMLKEIVVHVAIASVLLGSLKKAGVITVHESSPAIPNATARRLLMTAIAFGEAVASAAVDGVGYTKRVLASSED